jgi:hypothetical protein
MSLQPRRDVEVRCAARDDGAWSCEVTVRGPGEPTTHQVAVSAAALARFAPGALDPVDLVARSFAFLLAREPKTSILRRFDLGVIGQYFPDYEREIRRGR